MNFTRKAFPANQNKRLPIFLSSLLSATAGAGLSLTTLTLLSVVAILAEPAAQATQAVPVTQAAHADGAERGGAPGRPTATLKSAPRQSKLKDLLSLVLRIDKQAWFGNSRRNLEKITGRAMHPVSQDVVADLVEYQSDFKRAQTVQVVKSCLVKSDNTNCVELIIDPAQSISPAEVAETFGKWTRTADEDEQILPNNPVFIYERAYGQMRFEFKGGNSPSLIAVYITSNKGDG